MANNGTLNAAVTAIRAALDSEAALIHAQRGMRDAWTAAYAATRVAQENGQTQAVIGKQAKVSPATVGDYLTAATIHPSAWTVLEVLPARQGVRFTTLHSLVAGARKSAGTPAVREIIAAAAAKARAIPREDGQEPDAEAVAKVWAACVRKLHDASGTPKKNAQEPPQEPQEPATGDDGQEPTGGETVAQEPPTLDKRLGEFAAEAFALREAIAHGGACSRESLAAAMNEARALVHDIAAELSNTARATA
jgi:hypothetical protein